ncbi:hypothetical protein ACOTFF_09490 [Achromobacter xylosoxidans]
MSIKNFFLCREVYLICPKAAAGEESWLEGVIAYIAPPGRLKGRDMESTRFSINPPLRAFRLSVIHARAAGRGGHST